MVKRFYLSLFFGRRFYLSLLVVMMLFIFSFGIPVLFAMAELGFLFLIVVSLLDYLILFSRSEPLDIKREMSERFSNGDENSVKIVLTNQFPFTVSLRLIDELPVQFQQRDFFLQTKASGGETQQLTYSLKPLQRGEYQFGRIQVFVKSPLQLIVRRKVLGEEKMIRVWPSYFALRHFELVAYSNNLAEAGSKRIRKLGHSLEFEQIREYVTGDDIRSLNWKATARKGGQLMVNNYTDEKSQQVYCLIDKGRVMKMPFAGMTLLDYAINASLIISRVALIKQDKAGIITFAEQAGTYLPADRKTLQMNTILQLLYNQQTQFQETDYEKLFALVRNRITQRSLLILFTNFESLSGLQRQLPYIRSIARNHLLLVVFFENTELKQLTAREAEDVEQVYLKTIAEKFAYEKRMMVKELQKHGISCILTTPQNLTISTVNKYLEIKARQAI